ncbi:MAG: radical SAM family heme chaperone HemW [Cyclobacteriaceae bacterium]
MAGIYLHIPFCKQACHYCDFHFSTSLKQSDAMVNAICKEIELRKDFFGTDEIETVYFGGGTPSILTNKQLEAIINQLTTSFDLSSVSEYTLEANPDDISVEKLKLWKAIGVTRLSVGIQSFDDTNLSFLNRSHNSKEAIQSIHDALDYSFDLSIDLIYGIQTSTEETWANDLSQLSQFKEINHISAYCLTIEEQTTFGNWLEKKKIDPVEDDKAIQQYEVFQQWCAKQGFEQYEISNYARKEQYAIHNTNYWTQQPYLGIGPSAHSYCNRERSINIPNNAKYIKQLTAGEKFQELERLSEKDMLNEYVLTAIRTKWGIDINKLKTFPAYSSELSQQINTLLVAEKLVQEGNSISINPAYKLFSDEIASQLFV